MLVVLSVAVLAAVGAGVALLLTRDDGGGSDAALGTGVLPTAPATVPVTTARATVTTVRVRAGAWPVGTTGWTVVIATLARKGHPRAAAERLAAKVQGPGLVGRVLDSSTHPRLRPGVWIVYVGRYPTRVRAERAARQLRQAGSPRGVLERLTG